MFPIPSLGQITPDSSGLDPLALSLTSIVSVITVATLLVQRVVKPLISRYPNTLGALPTQAYLVPLACLLTYVANRYLITLPGDNVWRLIRDTVVTILGSPGLYTMPEALRPIRDTKAQGFMLKKDDSYTVAQSDPPFSTPNNPTPPTIPSNGPTPPNGPGPAARTITITGLVHGPNSHGTPTPQSSATKPFAPPSSPENGGRPGPSPFLRTIALLPLLLILLPGCAASSDPFYEGIKSQWPPVRDTYNRLVAADPSLTPAEKQLELDSAINIDRLIAAEAQRRAATQPANALMAP